MPHLKLRYWPDKCLRNTCKAIAWDEPIDYETIGNQMIEIMITNKGYGLSAPQVGLDIQLFVMRDPQSQERGLIFRNPIITDKAGEQFGEEGCLSLPGMHIKIKRFKEIELQWDSINSPTERRCTFNDLDARCIQHEMDHLQGIMIFDHINSNLGRKRFLEQYAKKRRKHARIG